MVIWTWESLEPTYILPFALPDLWEYIKNVGCSHNAVSTEKAGHCLWVGEGMCMRGSCSLEGVEKRCSIWYPVVFGGCIKPVLVHSSHEGHIGNLTSSCVLPWNIPSRLAPLLHTLLPSYWLFILHKTSYRDQGRPIKLISVVPFCKYFHFAVIQVDK